MRVALDTNCFIDATNSASHAHQAMHTILGAQMDGRLRLAVSCHTLAELKKKPDEALALAETCEVLPHYPIGAWKDQVASWKQLAGTWDVAKRNEQIQQELETLAKAGNDLRDRGAYIDALYSGSDGFVTSDRQLAGSGPAKRIEQRFDLRVVTPEELALELSSPKSR